MKRNIFTILIVLLSIFVLFTTLLTLPVIDRVKPDPYFHVKVTPIIYWVGFSLAILVSLRVVFSKKEGSVHYSLGLFSVTMLSIYIYVIPKLFYVNSIYTDTYIFVGELLHILRYGYLGYGHAHETPGLSLFSSQFRLITGIDHITVAKIVQFIIPLLIIFFIYMIAKLFTNKRVALLTCLVFMSLDWMGFYFNRQSLSLMFQMFVYYGLFKALSFNLYVSWSWYAILLLSYTTLVVIHPLSSLMVPFTTLSLVILIYLFPLMRRIGYIIPNNKSLSRWIHVRARALQLSLTFLVIWFSWNLYTYKTLSMVINTIIKIADEFLGQPIPFDPAKSYFVGYTKKYLPIVYLRLSNFIYEAVIGVFLALIAFLKMKDRRVSIILLSWFVSCWFTFPSLWIGSYTRLNRAFLHALPVFSILFAWFIIRASERALLKSIKGCLLGTMIIFSLLLPISMYCVTPFYYPPTSYLAELDYITKHGYGYIAFTEADAMIGYFKLLNNASNLILNFRYNSTTIIESGTIVTTFRGYTKGAFTIESQSFMDSIMVIDKGITKNSIFARVYDADLWHRIYVKQSSKEIYLEP